MNDSHQKHPYRKGMECAQLLSDARFLMRDYHIPISLSALQVYHSGVVSMPECALRKKTGTLSVPRLITKRENGWQTGMIILYGHTSVVRSVAFSYDSLWIVSCSYDNTVRIWDATSGTIQYTLEGHTSGVTSVAFSSDGLRIVSGSYDGTVRIWDANTGAMQHILEEYDSRRSLGTFLAASALRNGWRILSLRSRHC
jgi:WD40 repeat protein